MTIMETTSIQDIDRKLNACMSNLCDDLSKPINYARCVFIASKFFRAYGGYLNPLLLDELKEACSQNTKNNIMENRFVQIMTNNIRNGFHMSNSCFKKPIISSTRSIIIGDQKYDEKAHRLSNLSTNEGIENNKRQQLSATTERTRRFSQNLVSPMSNKNTQREFLSSHTNKLSPMISNIHKVTPGRDTYSSASKYVRQLNFSPADMEQNYRTSNMRFVGPLPDLRDIDNYNRQYIDQSIYNIRQDDNYSSRDMYQDNIPLHGRYSDNYNDRSSPYDYRNDDIRNMGPPQQYSGYMNQPLECMDYMDGPQYHCGYIDRHAPYMPDCINRGQMQEDYQNAMNQPGYERDDRYNRDSGRHINMGRPFYY